VSGGRWPAAGAVPLFTPAQYEELEQQALIYKYMVAGVPVPPDLVVPIRRGLDSLAARFYAHPTRTCGTFLAFPLPAAILPALLCFRVQVQGVLAPSSPGVLLALCLFQSSVLFLGASTR
jgi:hypothetical protein